MSQIDPDFPIQGETPWGDKLNDALEEMVGQGNATEEVVNEGRLSEASLNSTYAPLASPTFTGTVSGVTKAMVGLGNADNTSDADKPVSDAQADAITDAVAFKLNGAVLAVDESVPVGLPANSLIVRTA